MKNLSFISLIILFTLLLQGCIDETVKTKINADGTCERIITGDSAFIYSKLPFNISLDKSWKVETNKDTITIRKSFASFDELAHEFRPTQKLNKLNVSVKIDKKFRWFFTHYTYNETYQLNNPWKKIPANEFFSPGELNLITADSLNKALENKMEEYWLRILFGEIYAIVENEADYSGHNITKEDARNKKEVLFNNLRSDSLLESASGDDLINDKKIIRTIEVTFGIVADERLRKAVRGLSARVDSDFTTMFEMGNVDWNEVIMPGIIVNTNSSEIIGNKLKWKLNLSSLLFIDKEMQAESRIINTWAFIVTGIVVLLILAGLIIPFVRRRRI